MKPTNRSTRHAAMRIIVTGLWLMTTLHVVAAQPPVPVAALQATADVSGDAAKPTRVPKSIAGRTLDEVVEETKSGNRIARLRAVRSLRPFGEAATRPLIALLDHEDAAIRYLAAESVGDLERTSIEPAVERLTKMMKEDKSAAVQMAAAYAICRSGETKPALETLIARMGHPERGMVCSAALLIGKLGPEASDAIPTLKEVMENNPPQGGGDYHKGGAAKNALRKLGAIQ